MRFETLRNLLGLLIGLGTLATAMAADSVPPDLAGLPWVQIGIGAALSLWGGLTRTAERALEAVKAEPPQPFPIWLELAKDVVVSSGVGFLTFAVGAWQEWGVWLLGAALWLGGYAGARLLSRVGEGWVEALAARLQPPAKP